MSGHPRTEPTSRTPLQHTRIAVVDRAAFLTRPEHRGLRVIALVSLLVAWEALARTGRVPVLFLPSPLGVLAEGWEMLRSGELLGHLASSLQRLVLGFALEIGRASCRE